MRVKSQVTLYLITTQVKVWKKKKSLKIVHRMRLKRSMTHHYPHNHNRPTVALYLQTTKMKALIKKMIKLKIQMMRLRISQDHPHKHNIHHQLHKFQH